MWNPFSSRDAPTTRPVPRVGDEDPSSERLRQRATQTAIAEIERVGPVAVATLTVTELSQDEGAEQLADLLQELSETGALHFVLDVQNVQFMDTTCLGCLVEALNRLTVTGGRIALASPNHSVHYVFQLTRLDRVFRICPDVMAAIEAVEGRRAAG